MSDIPPTAGDGTDEGAGEAAADPGPPVEPLQDFTLPDDEAFVGRVGRRLERRLLTNELLTFAWHAPVAAALEWLTLPFAWKSSRRPPSPPSDRS